MKFFTSKSKFKKVGFIVLLACSSLMTFSQGPSSKGYSLSSCYHTLSPNNTGQILNVLNLGEFQINYSPNAGAQPDFIRIRLFDQQGGFIGYDYEQIGLADGQFNVTNHPDYGRLIAAHRFDESENKWLTNNNKFTFPEFVGTAEITTYHWTGDPGDHTIDPSNYKMNINLIAVEDAFTPKSNNAQCLTFDNFNLGILNNLDGFCGKLTSPKIKPLIPLPHGSGWDPNFSRDVIFGESITIDQPNTDQGVKWCEDDRNQQMADPNVAYPVPSGCINFELKYELEPCSSADSNCPTIEIIQEITICCSCDIRPLGPSN